MLVEVLVVGSESPLEEMGGVHVVEGVHHLLVVGVVLAAALEAPVVAGVGQAPGFLCRRPPGLGVARQHVLSEGVPPDAPDGGRRAREAHVDHLVTETDDLEDLCSPVGVDGGDPHLGEDLQNAVLHRRVVALLGLGAQHVRVLRRVGVGRHREKGQAGADGVGAVPQQAGHVMDVAGVVGHHHQAGVRAQTPGDQALVDGAGGQQRRYRGAIGGHVSVVHHEDSRTLGDEGLGLVAQAHDRCTQPPGPVGHREVSVEPGGGELGALAGELVDGGGVDEEGVELDLMGGLRTVGQQGPTGADQGPQAHHQPLPQMVDGGVGDLCEALLQVVVQRAGTPGPVRQGGVVAHGEGGLLGLAGHGLDHHAQLLHGVPVGDLSPLERRSSVGLLDRPAEVHAPQTVCGPDAVGRKCAQLLLALVVEHHAPFRVDEEHLAGAEATPPHAAVTADVDGAGLRAAGHQAVFAYGVAEGPQAVAIERRPHAPAVGEDEAGRTVPRLHQAGVVAVEAPHRRLQVPGALPRLGHEHGHGVADVPPALDEQLHGGVDLARIRVLGVQHRPEHLFGPEAHLDCAEPAPRLHAVEVAADGVDLAVVAEGPEGLGSLPRRGGVGGEALVEDGEVPLEALVGQVQVVTGQQVGCHQALVEHRAERAADHVGAGGGGRHPAAQSIGRSLRVALPLPRQDGLDDSRATPAGHLSDLVLVCGWGPPVEDLDALRRGGGFQCGPRVVTPDEEHGDAVALAEEGGRYGGEQPRAVSRLGIGAQGAPVDDARQALQGRGHDGAGGPSLGVGDEADPACITFRPH